jgi:5-methylcytosine-specific restriction endonuclease McrA
MAIGRLPSRMGRAPSRVAMLPKKAESFYQSAGWLAYRKAHRAETVRRQGGVWCVVCGSRHKLILDHVVERRDGGPDFPSHDGAKWYCGGCHNAKTARARAARISGVAKGSEAGG